MARFLKLWKVILLDTLGVILMIGAILAGWLPGAPGIPLFILGLSLVAVHHDWAKRYVDLLKKYADKLWDHIFIKDPRWQLAYDIAAGLLLLTSAFLLIRRSAMWMIYLGIFGIFMGLGLLLGNRDRWLRFRGKV